MIKDKGRLFVISGPSGAGKSTVLTNALEGRVDTCFSTSVTTRAPRPGEVEGVDYFFIDHQRFYEMVKNNELLEHAEYVSNRYGTPKAYVLQKMDEGFNVILDIPKTLKDFGIIEEEFLEKIDGIAERAVGDACTGSNPRAIDPATMKKLFTCIYYGTEVDF